MCYYKSVLHHRGTKSPPHPPSPQQLLCLNKMCSTHHCCCALIHSEAKIYIKCDHKTVWCSQLARPHKQQGTFVFLSCIIIFFLLFHSPHIKLQSELLPPSVFSSWIMFSSSSRSLHLQVSQTYWHAFMVQSQQSPWMNHVAAGMHGLSFYDKYCNS